ncbi:MAG: alpha/beta fold hydrolase [Candidatus Helarchaeota archaeon]
MKENDGIKFEIDEYLQKMRVNPIAKNGIGYYFKTNSGDKLYYRVWESPDKNKIVIGIHGMAAHSEYYVQVADQLINHRISVYALDLKHHGHSTGHMGDLENFQELIDQLNEFIIKIHDENEGVPIYLIGISMGGCIAINYSIQYPDLINGLILMAPAVKTNLKFSFFDILKLPILGILYLFSKGKPIINIGKRSELLGTRNELRRIYERNDEYRIKKVSIRYLLQVNSWVKKAFKNAIKINHPVIIFQGTEDKLVLFNGVKQFYNNIKISNKTFIELEGAYHTLYSDPSMVDEGGWEKLRQWVINH